jgi:DMSO/TMAO reductase YedYZ molybdopterin-dependent catalytic subunit
MDWTVLHVEPTPSIDTAGWSFEIDGLVARPVRWSWEEIHGVDLVFDVIRGDIGMRCAGLVRAGGTLV